MGDDYIKDKKNAEHLKKFKDIWGMQRTLLELLRVSFGEDKDDKRIAHYRSMSNFENYIGLNPRTWDGEGKSALQALKMTCVVTANDPMEGKTLQYFLEDSDHSGEPDKIMALQASFSEAEDNLTQFRLYCKRDGKEGTGLCLIFNKHFFDDKPGAQFDLPNDEDKDKGEDKPRTLRKRPLYWVLYYDKKTGNFLHTPSQVRVDIYNPHDTQKQNKQHWIIGHSIKNWSQN